MDRDKEPELQIVEIEPEREQDKDQLAIEYQILNEKLDAIIQRIKQRKSKTTN